MTKQEKLDAIKQFAKDAIYAKASYRHGYRTEADMHKDIENKAEQLLKELESNPS